MNDRSDSGEAYEATRTGTTVAAIKRAFLDNLHYIQAKFPAVATRHDCYKALAYTVRDRLLSRWFVTAQTYYEKASRTVCYLSAEYMIGPQLGMNLLNLGIWDQTAAAMSELGLNLNELLDQEEEPGLGNGGLGRLAACFLESLATRQIAAIGYGIRYEFGIFDQAIRDGWQVELTDKWLRYGNPWEIARPEIAFPIGLGGSTRAYQDESRRYRVEWTPDRMVLGVAYDTPILGYGVNTANLLRLWQAQAIESFDFKAFNVGDYYGAVSEKIVSENITKVLYPNDEPLQGKVLRLQQQYFFVSCALQDAIRIVRQQRTDDLSRLHEKLVVQLNDTHPAIAVAELMRLLVDVHLLDWDAAWHVTRSAMAYTNHTLLPEALETWPLELFQRVLPRHLEIIFEINRRFLAQIRQRHPGDEDRVRRMSLIDEDGRRAVRMAHLACVGSFHINGVSQLHSRLLRASVLRDFYELEPEKFGNVTNGVSPRRFMALANPPLAQLIDGAIGKGWLSNLEELRQLEPLAEDGSFRRDWRSVKRAARQSLVNLARRSSGISLDADTLFDVQAKRFHEYKRQHLNLLHIVASYLKLRESPGAAFVPRTFVFAGKAAPGYRLAKLVIRLVNGVAEVVNADPVVHDRLRVVFVPDFNVKTAQYIYPAADLSEQISTAGKEASGTGNMKFGLNGALTIGTLDGANVEIRQDVGAENFFMFGLTTDEVAAVKAHGYQPRDWYRNDPVLRGALDAIAGGIFSRGDRSLFRPLIDHLLDYDPFLVLADFASYCAAQAEASRAFADPEQWTRMSILNVARLGRYSSDRSIVEYCRDVWQVQNVHIEL
jgi:glycogen phosphorylase